MKFVVAIQESNAARARQAALELGCEVVKSRLESQLPALRNLQEGLQARGLNVVEVNVFWFLLAGDGCPQAMLQRVGVAVAVSDAWLQQQAASIRYLKGIAYCDACSAWADYLSFNCLGVSTPAASVQTGEGINWWGQTLLADSEFESSSLTAVAEDACSENISLSTAVIDSDFFTETDAEKLSATSTLELAVVDRQVEPLTSVCSARENINSASAQLSLVAEVVAKKKPRSKRKPRLVRAEEQLDLFGL